MAKKYEAQRSELTVHSPSTIFTAGRRFWPTKALSKRDPAGTKFDPIYGGVRRHAELCQRLFHNGAVPFFLLVAGDVFLHRLVEILPGFGGKRQVVESIERSAFYRLTLERLRSAVIKASARPELV